MSNAIYGSTLVYPALMQGKFLTANVQKDRNNSQQAPQNPNLPNLSQHQLQNDQLCFSGQTQSSEGRARDAERAYQKVQSHPKASQKDKEYFQEVSDQQYTASGKAKKVGSYVGMGAGAATSLKGAALTPAHPVAGPALAMSSPAVVKNVAEQTANILHDKVFDRNNYVPQSSSDAEYYVVQNFLKGKTSAQNGSAYEFDHAGNCYELEGISKEQEKEMQKRYEQLSNSNDFISGVMLIRLRREVEKYIKMS